MSAGVMAHEYLGYLRLRAELQHFIELCDSDIVRNSIVRKRVPYGGVVTRRTIEKQIVVPRSDFYIRTSQERIWTPRSTIAEYEPCSVRAGRSKPCDLQEVPPLSLGLSGHSQRHPRASEASTPIISPPFQYRSGSFCL